MGGGYRSEEDTWEAIAAELGGFENQLGGDTCEGDRGGVGGFENQLGGDT